MITWLKNKISIFGITKYKRVENYLKNLENNVKIKNKKDEALSENILKLIKDRIKRLKRLYFISYIFYFGIYFSFVSFFFSDFFFLSKISILLSKVIGFFGTTTFVLGLFFTIKIKELYYQDLNLLSSHLIVIYDNNLIFNDNLFETNEYNKFIDFFKKRGF